MELKRRLINRWLRKDGALAHQIEYDRARDDAECLLDEDGDELHPVVREEVILDLIDHLSERRMDPDDYYLVGEIIDNQQIRWDRLEPEFKAEAEAKLRKLR